ncbi:hypothetical protein [Coleofasciculus chthonoplastes]|jgi:uncharacterized repeat protein (TIGR01451 family)/fimbrial isopeptide formation D2 family protein|uniref:hypothetical protein n=1 Tax=Coleofasciculus chthonoplastes TaxID=64178 RepID=UPI0032F211AF
MASLPINDDQKTPLITLLNRMKLGRKTFQRPGWLIGGFALLMGLGWTQPVRAEGSKEFTDNMGNRAFLDYRSDSLGNPNASIPRRTTLNVYANPGETLNLGSSAVGIGSGRIEAFAPDGTRYVCGASEPGTIQLNNGLIQNRTQEEAGPLPAAGGYTPCSQTGQNGILVGAGQTGIWEITFVAPDPLGGVNNDPGRGGSSQGPIAAGGSWATQNGNDSFVTAWDVTVTNSSGSRINGRTYATYLPLNLGTSGVGLNAVAYVQTREGFLYRIDLNGLDPFGFIFFANNKGFLDQNGNALYRSVPFNDIRVHLPNAPDTATDFTHKIFFNPPNADLPPSASLAGGGSTWLRADPLPPIPTITDLTFTGNEGTPNQVGPTLGGKFTFNVDGTVVGSYSITIDVNRDGIFGNDNDVILDGVSQPGDNIVEWNGIDAAGERLQAGTTPYQSRLALFAGDVHFPFFDPESNQQGLIIERIDRDTLEPQNSRIFYNDDGLELEGNPTDPISALGGVLSAPNGAHSFGDGTERGFGNQNGINTWTSLFDPVLEGGEILVKIADLSIDKMDEADPVAAGEPITYTLTVTSEEPPEGDTYSDVADARVTDTVPADITNVTWNCAITSDPGTGACGTASGTGNSIDLTVDLNVGATATITVNGIVSPTASGTLNNTATVERPPDTFDPNEENNTDPEDTTIEPNPVQPVGIKSVRLSQDTDGSGSLTQGDIVEYTITYANSDPSTTITNFQAVDEIDTTSLQFVEGSYSLTASGAGTTVTSNPNYNGTSDPNLNNPGALGPDGGQVVIQYEAEVIAAAGAEIRNQAVARSNGGTVPESVTDAFEETGDLPQLPDDGIDQGNLPGTGDDDPTLLRVEGTPVSQRPQANKSVLFLRDNDNTSTLTIGDDIQYTIIVRNPTPRPITNLTISDAIPFQWQVLRDAQNPITVNPESGFTLASPPTLPADTFVSTGTPVTFTNPGTLAPGAEVIVRFNVRIRPGSPSPLINQGRVRFDGDNDDPVLTDASDSTNPRQPGSDVNPGIPLGDPTSGNPGDPDFGGNVNQPNEGDADPTIIRFVSPVTPTGTKSVRLAEDTDGTGSVTTGDILEYTIIYTNPDSTSRISNFLAEDTINPEQVSFVPGSYQFTAINGAGGTNPTTTVTQNPDFNGTDDTNLTNSTTLGELGTQEGRVEIRYRVRIEATAGAQISNQARVSSTGGSVDTSLTDALAGPNDLPQELDDGIEQGNLAGTGDDDPTLVRVQPRGNPRLRLVKRITNITRNGVPISGINFNTFLDDPEDEDDNILNQTSVQPVGIFSLPSESSIQSGDEVEYTIYFLSDGTARANTIQICDAIPEETTFVTDSFDAGQGILVNQGGTNTNQSNLAGDDRGEFLPPLSPVTSPCPNLNNPNGSVLINLGDVPITTPDNGGFVRFRVRVD